MNSIPTIFPPSLLAPGNWPSLPGTGVFMPEQLAWPQLLPEAKSPFAVLLSALGAGDALRLDAALPCADAGEPTAHLQSSHTHADDALQNLAMPADRGAMLGSFVITSNTAQKPLPDALEQSSSRAALLAPSRWAERLATLLAPLLPNATIQAMHASLHGTDGSALSFVVTVLDAAAEAIEASSVPAPLHREQVALLSPMEVSLANGSAAAVGQGLPAGAASKQQALESSDRTPGTVAGAAQPPVTIPSGSATTTSGDHRQNSERPFDDHDAVLPTVEPMQTDRALPHATVAPLHSETSAPMPPETGLRAVLRATITALWQGNQSAARVVLEPASLGTIVVHLAMRGSETVVQIVVSSAETLGMVTQTVDTLRTELHASGVRADAIAVRLADPPALERHVVLPPTPVTVAAVGDDQTERRRQQRQQRQRTPSRHNDQGQFEHFM
ncbi:MAG: hypothetical protein KatS3mg039_1577 [Candidatus Kapaibacterium sp.]|nr:MAG: hypothetical protein KatS3mg039_1577 [Candidatus Kapabacteria bacterium]